jgi:hypothetical protein
MAEIRFKVNPVHVGLGIGALAVVVIVVVLLIPHSDSVLVPQQPVVRPLTGYDIQLATERAIANQKREERMHNYFMYKGPYPLP